MNPMKYLKRVESRIQIELELAKSLADKIPLNQARSIIHKATAQAQHDWDILQAEKYGRLEDYRNAETCGNGAFISR
jgi:hypothetical protein